jgi:hypothetical protein
VSSAAAAASFWSASSARARAGVTR